MRATHIEVTKSLETVSLAEEECRRWIYPISQGCHNVVYIDKANFTIKFPRTRELTSNEEISLIYMVIVLLIDNEKGLLICALDVVLER